ncbi:MAG: POTRA domain-containing protein [Steroidobacteraceae bacterium]
MNSRETSVVAMAALRTTRLGMAALRVMRGLGMAALLHASAAGAAAPAAAAHDPGFAAAPMASASEARDANAVRVVRIAFRGNRALPASALQAVAAPYLMRELSSADIEALRGALTRRYTDAGYVNSRVLVDPDAPYREGVLSFLVVEGRIADIRVHGLNGLRPSYVVDRLRGADDEALNTDVLRERLQRLSEDPLFARVSSRVEPGPDAGEAILDVDVQRARPYSVSLALNNYRPPSIGEKAYDISAQARDLTGFGDALNADLSGPIGSSGGVGYGLDGQLPVGRYGSVASLSAARINTVITEEPLSALDAQSTIERQEFKVTQPVWSTLRQQFNLGASIADETESTQGGDLFSLLTGSSEGFTRSLTARLMPEYSYRSQQQYLTVRLTLLHADLLDRPPGAASDAGPDQSYFVWSGQVHQVWEFAHAPFELESRAIVQRTDSRISDLHALEIGGINSVRGFREDDFLASNAANFNVDFRWLALRTAASARPGLTLGTFFDWAAGHDADEPTDTFSSCGLTFRLKWPHVQTDLAYGLPLVHPAFVSAEHGSWQDHGIHVQIAATL